MHSNVVYEGLVVLFLSTEYQQGTKNNKKSNLVGDITVFHACIILESKTTTVLMQIKEDSFR